MAFDQPLDADRVDGDGFISSFVRAPIVGPVMWVLGGLLAKDMAGEENKILEEDILNKDPPNQALPRTAKNSKIYADSHRSIALPTSMECEPTHMNEVIHVTPSVSSEEDNDDRNIMPLARRKGRRKMSWADESGQSLDDYYEQVSPFIMREEAHIVLLKHLNLRLKLKPNAHRSNLSPKSRIFLFNFSSLCREGWNLTQKSYPLRGIFAEKILEPSTGFMTQRRTMRCQS
jgi:hypothetical protein